ncbi:hypothetical protein U1Q18_009532 [Sarracenia purpurea var. burkii]
MGDRPWGASSSIRAMKTSKQSRNRDSFSSKLTGGPGYRMQGKYGKDLNHFHALPSPDFDDYDVFFPALSGASKSPIEDLSSSATNPRGATSSSTPVSDYDCVEEGSRLERLTVTALNRAKKGRSPLTQEEQNHLESWLVRYRASKADFPNQRGASNNLGVSASVCDLTGQVEASLKDLSPAIKIQIPAERDLIGTASAILGVSETLASENESLDGADEVSKAGDKREEDEGAYPESGTDDIDEVGSESYGKIGDGNILGRTEKREAEIESSPKADPGSLIKKDDESEQEEVTTEEEEESTDVSGEEGSESGDEESEEVGVSEEEASTSSSPFNTSIGPPFATSEATLSSFGEDDGGIPYSGLGLAL